MEIEKVKTISDTFIDDARPSSELAEFSARGI